MRRLGILLLLIALAALAFVGWVRWELSRPYKGYAAPRELVDIPRGMSRRGIAGLLEREGVIANSIAFEAYSRWHSQQGLKAGEYLFDRPMTLREVFGKIAAGRVYAHTILVREGWTMFDIAEALEKEGLCRREEFLAVARDPSLVADLAPSARSLEGFLFPSTYEFTKHMAAQEIAATMVRHFRSVWEEVDRPSSEVSSVGLPVPGIVTVASLVERETPRPQERPIIAGVFYNRLRRGLPLQCDPTIQYALALVGEPSRTVRPADLAIHSPYNTYRHAGLPPGPIANPGEISLRAALSPQLVPYFYFVADAEGGHFFSRTLAEHNRNVARYRRLRREESPASAPPDPDHRSRP